MDCEDAEIEAEDRTVGIDFYYWKAEPHLPNGLEVLIVDCAGQRQYLLTHQLFLCHANFGKNGFTYCLLYLLNCNLL